MENKRRYNYMDPVLQKIHSRYISLPNKHVKRNNTIIKQVIGKIINKMKEKDQLFNLLFTDIFYGGSFYDGLKVGEPEEFDLDLQLKLPEEMVHPTVILSNIPGFLNIRLDGFQEMLKTAMGQKYRRLADFLDHNNYLLTTEVSAWMESVIRLAMNDFPSWGNDESYNTFKTYYGRFRGKIHRGGPAFTLKLKMCGVIWKKPVEIDVDLVPSFTFGSNQWPCSPFLPNPVREKPNFFVVPKRPHRDDNVDRYWRPSFQMQERELIKNKFHLKPTIKLLKKLLTNLKQNVIASYYIKTIFLMEVVQAEIDFWRNSQSYVFMIMLNKLYYHVNRGYILYFWNQRNDLLNAKDETIQDLANRLRNIIQEIESEQNEDCVVAEYLLDEEEFADLENYYIHIHN